MRDAIGGAMTLQIILIFLVLVTCILAFSVNYAKAFRLKNAVLDTIEDGQGVSQKVSEQLDETRSNVGYGIDWKIKDYHCKNGICIQFNEVTDNATRAKYCGTVKENDTSCTVGSYSVVTFIYVNVPIMQNILQGLQTAQRNGALNISGDTSVFRVVNNSALESWTS